MKRYAHISELNRRALQSIFNEFLEDMDAMVAYYETIQIIIYKGGGLKELKILQSIYELSTVDE